MVFGIVSDNRARAPLFGDGLEMTLGRALLSVVQFLPPPLGAAKSPGISASLWRLSVAG